MRKRAKTDQIDAELIARFLALRPEVGRTLPDEKLQLLRALTVRRAQMVEARKRLSAQISARRKQGVSAELEDMDSSLKAFLESQISELDNGLKALSQRQQNSPPKQGFSVPFVASARYQSPCFLQKCQNWAA